MNKPFLLMIAVLAISITTHSQACTPTEDQSVYGTGNRWRGYVYQGTSFNDYRGMVYQGTSTNANFDQGFGGAKVTYNTSACSVITDTFSVRYRLGKNFTPGIYTFVVGADAGYRLSFDGGDSWAVSNWTAHTYTTSSYNVTLSGLYNMVLEFYDNLGSNRIMFSMIQNTVLPVKLLDFSGKSLHGGFELSWRVTPDVAVESFGIERSEDGSHFENIGSVKGTSASAYGFADNDVINGTVFYRIKISDRDGPVIYSGVISRRSRGFNGGEIRLLPTIIQGTTLFMQTAATLADASIVILDATGRTVSRQFAGRINGGQASRVETSFTKLPTGVYFLVLSEGNRIAGTCRFIVK